MTTLWTKQETFDTIVKAMIKQGRPAINAWGNCAYRTKTNEGTTLACAVGCIIPDEIATPEFCNRYGALVYAVEDADFSKPLFVAIEGHDLTLLKAFQYAHDVRSTDPGWLDRFVDRAGLIAMCFDLNPSACSYCPTED